MKKYIGYFFLILLLSCASQEQKTATEAIPLVATGKSVHSEAFDISFKLGMDGYYELKERFVTEDRTAIDTAAAQLIRSVTAIKIDSIGGDSTIMLTAKSYTQGINAELVGLIGETDIEEKRKAFQMVSEQLYDLIRTVQYDREVVYHQFCPMAFNNEGATWLSNTRTIRNPYLPTKMLDCGELRDSIDFRRKNQ